MSKQHLIDRMRDTSGITTAVADLAIRDTFRALRAALEDGETVRIPGFGTFTRKFIDTRQRRNPKTGDPVTVAAHHKLVFKETKAKR